LNIIPKVIDIFHGDNVTDFSKARAFGIRGVIHKATEGGAIVDRAYGARRKLAGAAGLLWGAYHFIRPGDMKHQARHFMDLAEPDANTLLALDHEDSSVPLAAARQFAEAVEAELGRKLVLYSGFLIKEQIVRANADDITFFAARPLWLCHYAANPTWPKAWPKPFLWQFTGDGDGPGPHAVPGIQDRMDINSFQGTDDELTAAWPGTSLFKATVGTSNGSKV
jgi:GH25 family lysozyme M1 (1,4-beta-N-acetylmuramidase)